MKLTNYKIVIAIIAGVAFLVIAGYVILNASYFYKQIKFFLNPPKIDATVPEQKEDPNKLSIPSLGITAPIVKSAENNESSFQEALKSGVVHYPDTALAGHVGNMYIFGHSSDLVLKGGDYKTVFALLPSIEKGAEIIVSDAEGQSFTYVVTDSFVANSTDVDLLSQDTGGKKVLTLQTSYPIGTALKRWIVVAELK